MMKLLSVSLLIFCCLAAKAAEMRILSLCAAANDILISTGQREKLAAIDQYGTIVPGTEDIPVVGKGSALSREKILELGITHAIIWHYQTDTQSMLRGITIIKLPSVRLGNYEETVRLLCKLTGAENAGEKLIAEFRKQTVPAVEQPLRRPKVYFELYSPYKTAGGESYIGDLIALAGGDNIAADMPRPGMIKLETIMERQPDIIFLIGGFCNAEELSRRPGFGALPAVRNHKIYPLDRKLFIAGLNPSEAVQTLKKYLSEVQ